VSSHLFRDSRANSKPESSHILRFVFLQRVEESLVFIRCPIPGRFDESSVACPSILHQCANISLVVVITYLHAYRCRGCGGWHLVRVRFRRCMEVRVACSCGSCGGGLVVMERGREGMCRVGVNMAEESDRRR